MKLRGLLVAVIVLGALGGVLVWSNKKTKEAAAKPAADAAPKILTIPEDQFQEVRLDKNGQVTAVRKDKDGKWQLTQPTAYRADQDTVSSLVSSLSSLSADKLVEDKANDLAAYGLAKPSMDITIVKKDGKTDQLYLGDDVPTGAGVYARVNNDPRVFTIASFTKTNLDKSPSDLRDKRLLTFDSDKLTRVDLAAKGESLEFGKNNQNDWTILKPRPLRADGSQVDELIRKLKDAKMDAAISPEDAKKAAAAFASGKRVAVAAVADASGNQQLEVRQDKDKNYYAKSSVVEGVYKVSNDLGDGINKGLDDFRNKKLFDFGWNDPSKVEVHNGAAAATYSKSGEKWMNGPQQLDAPSVQALIDKLRDLSATKFQDSGAAGNPVFETTVTSNDGKRVEKVTISQQGAQYLAKREGEPSIYVLDAQAVKDLQKAATDVKPYQQPKKK